MPRRSARTTVVEGDCRLGVEDVLRVMADMALYERFPALEKFRPKVIRAMVRSRRLSERRVHDGDLRKLYHDTVKEFADFLWELQQSHAAPAGFAAFMEARHNTVAGRFVIQAGAGPVVLE